MPAHQYYLPERRLVSQDDAAIIQRADVPRSVFTGSWTLKTAFDAGILVPIMVDELLPGDHMRYDITAYIRMSTPLFPIFDNQRVDTFFFFVPSRLIWANWVRFMGEQDDPSSSIAFTIPQLVSPVNGPAVGSLADYFGLPVAGTVTAGNTISFSALPFRAYNLIYNTWFRDENLIGAAYMPTDNGPDVYANYNLLRRAKFHDYFTSALPWPQKFTAPTVPVGGLAPIIGLGSANQQSQQGPLNVLETGGATVSYDWYKRIWNPTPSTDDETIMRMTGDPGSPYIYADLSQATGVAINTLRQAWLVQSLLERDARGGTRYVELIKSHFGVTNPDFRLQRPEYIGGGQTPLTLTPIAQTAPSTGVPVGALGAAGTATGNHHASYAATEHGYVIGLINVRTELSYQQGIHKLWSRSTRYDFYWPALAGLGEQSILRKELVATGAASDNDVFGYQERWHEYRARQSHITGIMRSGVTGTLDAWHLAQQLSSPTLNGTFIGDTPPMQRILAAGSAANGQQYIGDILFTRKATRPIPTFGTPAALGRF